MTAVAPLPELPVLKSPPAAKSPTPGNPGEGIDYEKFLDCVHCGLCTAACPTYLETGNENDSPRGRIYLMRAVTDGRLDLTEKVSRHLELCLDCRSCETACPSGVQYGRLIEPFRVNMQNLERAGGAGVGWFERFILYGMFPYADRLRMALFPARLMQQLGLDRLADRLGITRLLPQKLQRMQNLLPPLQPRGPQLPDLLPAIGPRRARVALFTGCVADAMFHHVHWATARVLQRNGCDVVIPKTQGCCGAIHYHSGAGTPALHMAEANAEAFPKDIDAVIVNVAGCGAMLKDYPHHWHDENSVARTEFASKVRDVCEFLDQLGAIAPRGAINAVCAYHDACHLRHAQQVADAPRKLLAKIPGLTLVPLAESEICCGAAGTYNLTEPEMSARLATRKVNNIEATGAQILATGNVGCILQIQKEIQRRNLNIATMHPIDLLDYSYRQETPPHLVSQTRVR